MPVNQVAAPTPTITMAPPSLAREVPTAFSCRETWTGAVVAAVSETQSENPCRLRPCRSRKRNLLAAKETNSNKKTPKTIGSATILVLSSTKKCIGMPMVIKPKQPNKSYTMPPSTTTTRRMMMPNSQQQRQVAHHLRLPFLAVAAMFRCHLTPIRIGNAMIPRRHCIGKYTGTKMKKKSKKSKPPRKQRSSNNTNNKYQLVYHNKKIQMLLQQ
mmetsp:Transcript_13763/g.33032  ORF Transcript_13763/g.33032 Transcript_13763/m.33032 type:complete len:214 (+) Transcript_13763:255-896(+)